MARLAILAVLCALLVPATALAATTRYASPTGTGTACSADAPCDIGQAVSGAGAGDDVVVGPGTYNLSAGLAPTVDLTMHGTPGASRPVIVGPDATVPIKDFNKLGLADLTIRSSNEDGVWMIGTGSTADRVEVSSTGGSNHVAIRTGPDLVVRDSLAVASGTNAGAVFLQGVTGATDVKLRNVTAIASGTDSTAVAVTGLMGATSAVIEATNVIADAATDLSATGTNASIEVNHSNFDTSTGTITPPTSPSPPPLFVNAAGGDYHEALGSPTIGTGLTDPGNGTLDLDGNARSTNGLTDIGAYQFQPAPTGSGGSGGSPGTKPGAIHDTTPPSTAIGGLKLSAKGVARLTLGCPASETRCDWTYSLSSSKPVSLAAKKKARVLKLASGHASAAGGRTATIQIRLSKKKLALIRRLHKLRVTLTVVSTDAAGNKATATRHATLRVAARNR
jgi:hypothetical protein